MIEKYKMKYTKMLRKKIKATLNKSSILNVKLSKNHILQSHFKIRFSFEKTSIPVRPKSTLQSLQRQFFCDFYRKNLNFSKNKRLSLFSDTVLYKRRYE